MTDKPAPASSKSARKAKSSEIKTMTSMKLSKNLRNKSTPSGR
jgi:hypothetical protein